MGLEKAGKGLGPTVYQETGEVWGLGDYGMGCGDSFWGWEACTS